MVCRNICERIYSKIVVGDDIMKGIPRLIGYGLAVTLLITSTFVIQIQLAYAGGKSPYESGYDHGCDDADLSPSDRYINEPEKGPSFHTDEFMSGYYDGFQECDVPISKQLLGKYI